MSVPQWMAVTLKMSLDPIVKSSEDVWMQTLRSTTWEWAAPLRYADHPLALRAAEMANSIWLGMSTPWDEVLRYAGRYMFGGFRYLEVMWRPEIIDGQARIGIESLDDCDPSAHAHWLTHNGRQLDAVEQYQRGSTYGRVGLAGNPRISSEKLLLLTHGVEGTNWRGDGGLLRSAYSDWTAGQHASDIRGIAMDRFGSPTPVAVVDRPAMVEAGYSRDQIARETATVQETLKAWSSHEETFLQTIPGITIAILTGNYDPSPLNATQQVTASRIRSAFLLSHMGMGQSDSAGSRALSTLIANIHTRAVADEADYIAGRLSGGPRPGAGIMARALRWNIPHIPTHLLPVIGHEGLQVTPLAEMLGVIPALVSAGLVDAAAVPALRRAISQVAGLNVRSDGTEGAKPMGPYIDPEATMAGPGRPNLDEEARA